MRKFEFHAYAGDEHGATAERADVTTKEFAETAQARAFDPPEQPTRDWSSRYITTASPSEYHAAGYRFERLDS